MIRSWTLFVLLFLLAGSPPHLAAAATNDVVSAVVGAPAGRPPTGVELENRSRNLSARLRCPVCQGLSIGDSPSSMAVNMKEEVRELVARGYSDQQVLRYFERSYGQFVLLDPPRRGINWLVWLLPLGLLVVGALLIRNVLRRREEGSRPAKSEDDEGLGPWIERVRQIADGSQAQ